MQKHLRGQGTDDEEIPNEELKLNLRSSVTTKFNLIEINGINFLFSSSQCI